MDKGLRPVLLLDVDAVLCISNRYGGFDAKLALAKLEGSPVDGSTCPPDLWTKLFADYSKSLLAKIDSEFHPWYVLTSSWWWHFTHDELVELLRKGGLAFVAGNLHQDWATPKGLRPGLRWAEIKGWVDAHPEFASKWVVLDDELSGTGLGSALRESEAPYIVLCCEDVGFTVLEYVKLRAALARRV